MQHFVNGILQGKTLEVPTEVEGKIVTRKSWTQQEIRNMSADQYKLNMQDPTFRSAIDKWLRVQDDGDNPTT